MKNVSLSLVLLLVATNVSIARAQSLAGDGDTVIRAGEFYGTWTGYSTTFSIQEVHGNGTFDGIAEFTGGPHKGTKFGFQGKFGKNQSLVVTRFVAGDFQVARAGIPKVSDGKYTWSAITRGVGIPENASLPFSLTIPVTNSK